jgi:hypothetical protein
MPGKAGHSRLFFVKSYAILSMAFLSGNARVLHKRRRLATPSEGGEEYAYYIDLSHQRCDNYDHCKKQKPPLGQVTVSSYKLGIE